MVKEFSFREAQPLLAFLEQNRDKIVGKTIQNFYTDNCFGSISDQPLVFELDDYVLVLHYFLYSDMTVQIVDAEQFHADETLAFLYENAPANRKKNHCVLNSPFPGLDCKITDIQVERFSEEFEVCPVTGKTRPAGGDYFRTITIHLDNGEPFYISGCDAGSDGYVEIWDDYNCHPLRRKGW